MITLKTLKNATPQEVFDQAAKHLLKQNAKSIDANDSCTYRGPEGLKCAVGCFIADEEYDSFWETHDASIIPQVNISQHKELLMDLQFIHDTEAVDNWPFYLKNKAQELGLNTKVLENE